MDSADAPVVNRPIVVGVDGSDSARDAAEWAADLAAIWGAPLHLLMVTPGTAAEPASGRLSELRDVAARAGARTVVAEMAQGEVADVIADRAHDARMLVLGSYGEGAWSGMLAGAVALTQVNRVACPIAVVRGTAPRIPPPRGGPVVVGVDGSSAGRAALTLAADLAASLGSRLVAVHAWSDIVFDSDGSGMRSHEAESVLATRASTLLDAELAEIALAHPGLPMQRSVVADTPLRALLAAADGARLLVVGHRGVDGGPGRRLGSTSLALVEFVPCPVVVTGPEVGVVPVPRTAQVTGATS
jgi:nucleotide-binding universal stress UspA family protein